MSSGLGNTKEFQFPLVLPTKEIACINATGAGANIDQINQRKGGFAKNSGKKLSKDVLEYPRRSARDINEGTRAFLDENGLENTDFKCSLRK